MRSICQLSQRWHQQYCSSPSFASHRRCLQQLQPIRYYRQTLRDRRDNPTKDGPRGSGLVVREYEQLASDPSSRVRIDPKAELKDEGKFIVSKLAKLERELAVLREGPFGPRSEFMRSLPENEREKVLKALEQESVSGPIDEDLTDTAEIDEMLENVHSGIKQQDTGAVRGVTLQIPQPQRVYIRNFNSALEKAVQKPAEPQPQLLLWKWYLRCQQHVVGFSRIIPEDVWETVWNSQTTAYSRPQYIIMLVKDMLAADVKLTSSQWIAYIAAIRDHGDIAGAVESWEEQRPALGSDTAVASDYWALGVRLYSALGRPQKAQDVAFECLEHSTVVQPDILLPVISAWAKSHGELALEKAWACYLKLRTLFQDRMTAEVYESVSSGFLHSGQPNLALAVFKDMMLASEKSADDSAAVYRSALRYVKDLQTTAPSEQIVNRISLSALSIFPKRFQNKFFFGAWIKQLIGRGDVDSAADVVELMYERGVTLDAKHLNGIVGAWLRDGSPSSQLKAERMAWAMINARIDRVKLVQRKRSLPSSEPEISPDHREFTPPIRLPPFLRRAAPPATIETFSILLQHYTRRGPAALENADHLTNVLTGPAQMTPNAFIMNHWLYAALRSSDVKTVWTKYSNLKNKIVPDLETFAVLWDSAKLNYDPSRAAHTKDFPSARLMFAEMHGWMQSLPESKARLAREQFSNEMYDQIIRSFCLSRDLRGALCALHGLKEIFQAYPEDETTSIIIFQVSKLLESGGLATVRRRSTRRSSSDYKQVLSRVAQVVETIAEQHGLKLMKRGVDPTELDVSTEEAKQLRLDILTEFLLSVTQTLTQTKHLRNEVEMAANVMGVNTGEIDFGLDDVESQWKWLSRR